jgi:uncharacterized repeat protein (TIGR01451 family)
MKLPSLKKILPSIVLPLALLAGQAQAAYNLVYTTTQSGAMTFTGNTIGLNKGASTINKGTSQAIGGYIAEGQAGNYANYDPPSTGNWTLNRSFANLTVPAGMEVVYAELIWGGSYSYGGEFRTLAERDGAVTMITPQGSNSVSPSAGTKADLGTAGSGGTCSTTSPPCFYVRSANVTTIIKALGSGTHRIDVGSIPATIGASENNLNTGGWTLAVAYKDLSGTLPEHKMNVYVGAEFIVSGGTAAPAAVTGFCTAPTGAQSGRLMASAMEGDPNIAGDAFRFGATNPPPTTNNLSGPNNLAGNFFGSQINKNDGTLDTSGSFGSLNSVPTAATGGTSTSGARQGWDITNVSLDAFLAPNQTTAYAQPITVQDTYMVNALGIQIKVGQPGFPTAVKRVNGKVASATGAFPAHQGRVGDIVTYNIKLNNATGTAGATNLQFTDMLPPGMSFVAGSFSRSNVMVMPVDPAIPPVTEPLIANAGDVPMPAANPVSPSTVSLPDIPGGSGIIVQFKAKIDSVPAAPAEAQYANTARWDYDYVPCAAQPPIAGYKITNPSYVFIPRLAANKTVAPTGTQNAGSTLTYSVTMTNNGKADSIGATLADAIPAGSTYVAGSTKLNGVAVPDVSGAMPFATAAAVNSAGQAAGVIAVGATATVSFQVTINGDATTVANSAVADVDGPGGEPPTTTPPVSTTVQPVANVSITKTDGVALVLSGTTTTYTIQVSNAGPSSANNTVVIDPAATGLNCTAVTCAAGDLVGGAVCPATLTMAALQGTGLTIPTLPASSSMKLQVTCTVTATGV